MKNIIITILTILTISFVSAANIGVSPATVNFENVLRGGYAERPVIVTIDSAEPVIATVQSRGEISSWFKFSKENFSVSLGNPYQLMVSVTPPSDTPNGNYTGFVTIKSTQLGQGSEGYATGVIVPTLDIYVVVTVTDEQVVACEATNFKVSSAEIGDDIVFTVDILNEGNVRFNPKITFDIWDQETTSLITQEEYSKKQIAPTTKEQFTISIPSTDLELGQYWVDVSAVDCYAKQTLTFDVLEVGALRAFGILTKLTSLPWANIDDIVPITATFRNDGEKSLEAKFKGSITYNNKIIQLLESEEPNLVPIDDESTFQFYFTPRNAGKYVISGRVFYDSKRSYEQTTIVNVKPGKVTTSSILRNVSYIVLIVLIAILIFKIRKQRKSIQSKRRMLR